MNQSDKYASIPSVMLADDLADYLIEVSEKFLIISINNNKYIQFFFYYLRLHYTRLLGQNFKIQSYGINWQFN